MIPCQPLPRYVENFQRGIRLVWDRFLDGKETDHVEVIEDDGIGEGRGTMESELTERETKRQERKRRASQNREEL